MKTKNKTIAMVEISIVLCSVFLLATLPAAAITNYESGITNYEETASEDDYVLGVYGNANEDDIIDMRDLTYVKLIFFGKKPETELADAKYDGKINPLDFIQIKLIIVGKEKELTIVDSADRIVTVKKPIKRVVTFNFGYPAEVMRALRAQDKIVGIDSYTAKKEIYFPELSKLPSVGGYPVDYEAVLSLCPDLVISWYNVAEHAEKLSGIPVVGFCLYKPDILAKELKKLGYILDMREEADEFIDFYGGYRDTIKERTEGISKEDRPRVYFETISKPEHKWRTAGSKSGWHQKIEMTGGHNIFGDIPTTMPEVDPEEVIMRDPQIILVRVSGAVGGGYAKDDVTELSNARDEIMSRPELANVAAVKNGKVYIISYDIFGGVHYLPGIAYCAKWFHSELFEDLDPLAINREYIERFQGVPYRGVYAYPEPS